MKEVTKFLLFLFIGLNLVNTASLFASTAPKVFINEFLPDAVGSDSGKEWVELYNSSGDTIDLSGWSIVTKSQSGTERKAILPTITIEPESYLIIVESSTLFSGNNKVVVGSGKLNMFNSDSTIKLIDENGSAIDSLEYSQSIEGRSFERQGPLCTNLNLHSASNTIGLQNSNYNSSCWISQPASYPTSYPVSFPLSYPVSFPISYPSSSTNTLEPTTIRINELYPYPDTAKGESEWIELFNYGDKPVNISKWYLKDRGSTGYTYGSTIHYLPDIFIQPGSYFIVENLKISLNNSGDEITLFTDKDAVADKFTYVNTKKSSSIILGGHITNPTPGSENEFVEDEIEESIIQVKTESIPQNKTVANVLASASFVSTYKRLESYDITIPIAKSQTKIYTWPFFMAALFSLMVYLIPNLKSMIKYLDADSNYQPKLFRGILGKVFPQT